MRLMHKLLVLEPLSVQNKAFIATNGVLGSPKQESWDDIDKKMVFYINLSILFIKNFLTYLLLVDSVFNQNFKIIFIILLIGICTYLLYKYHLDFTQIADKPMDSIFKHVINILIILVIGGVFWLRVSNINRTIDIYQVGENVFSFYINTNIIKFSLISLLLIILILLYIQIFQLLIRIFKYNIIKRHLWFYRFIKIGCTSLIIDLNIK